MSKRLALLERMVESGNANSQGTDPFAWYGLALEYKSLGRVADALRTFDTLRGRHAGYLPQYLMAGQVLSAEGRGGEARSWLEAGVALAREQGNAHALGELEAALAACREG